MPGAHRSRAAGGVQTGLLSDAGGSRYNGWHHLDDPSYAPGAVQRTYSSPHYSRVTELLVVQAFSSVMTQMDAGVMTIEAMRRPVG